MPVLLLAQGDAAARDTLRRAIETRYGLRPPVVESARIDFKGRVRAKLGPLTSWVPVAAVLRLQLPSAIRWDFVIRPVGVPVQRGAELFDGTRFRRTGGSSTAQLTTPDNTEFSKARLWAIAALMLTPLGDMDVQLATTDGGITATHRTLGQTVTLKFDGDTRLREVSVASPNPDTGERQLFILRPSVEMVSFGELNLPKRVAAYWDNEPTFEFEPAQAQNNPTLSEDIFTNLGSVPAASGA